MESNSALVLLAGAIFISLIIERLVEILIAWYRVLEVKNGWYRYWNNKAVALQYQLHDFRVDDDPDNAPVNESDAERQARIAAARERIVGALLKRLKVDEGPYAGVDSISAAKVRHYGIKYYSKALAIVLGIAVAVGANIDMIGLVDKMLNANNGPYSEVRVLFNQVATGIAMGLGSAPLHKMIAALEKARKNRVKT